MNRFIEQGQKHRKPLADSAYILFSGVPFLLTFALLALSSFLLRQAILEPRWVEVTARVGMNLLLLMTEVGLVLWAVVISVAAAPSLYPILSFIVGWNHKILRKMFAPVQAWSLMVDHAFIQFNNRTVWRLYGDKKPVKILLLISRCLQMSKCQLDLSNSIEDCRRCGKCQLPELIDLANSNHIEISFSPRTEDAMRRVKEYRPDLAIGVACENRLVKGLLGTLPGKAYLVGNCQSGKGCMDNKAPMDRLREILSHFC